MSWVMIAGAAIFVSLVAALILTEWVVRRAHPRKVLQWAENAPAKSARIKRR